MRKRWIGWSIVACVAATAAYAESARRSRPPRGMVRVDLGQPAPGPALAPVSVAPRADAAAKPAPPAEAMPPSPSPAPAPDGDPTPPPDPALAHGDRIEGGEVKGMVAFTFDDGPNVETTPHVIAALQKYDVPATFFIITRRLVGRLAERNREVLAKEVAGGFLIGSHTVSHTNLLTVSAKAIGHEVDQSLRVLSKEAGRAIGLFRPPFGALDDRGQEHLQRRGLTEVKWSIDSLDWRERDGDRLRQRTIAAILKQDGGVVLMHDAKEVTARSLGLLLDDLEAANCRRLAGGKEPILPVSIHYWLRDGGRPRPVPEEVQQRTLAYRNALPGRCAARPAPALEAGPEKQRARRRAPR